MAEQRFKKSLHFWPITVQSDGHPNLYDQDCKRLQYVPIFHPFLAGWKCSLDLLHVLGNKYVDMPI